MHPKGTGDPPDGPRPGLDPGRAVHPRLTTEWIRYSPGAGPGISEATIGWVVTVKHRLLAEGGWQLLDLEVYETLYRLVDLDVDADAGAVLQWTGTYDDLAHAIGGGNPRRAHGSFRFGQRALRDARERLEARGLVETVPVNDSVVTTGGGRRVRGAGRRWRIVNGGEARYDRILATDGPQQADRIMAAGPAVPSEQDRPASAVPSRHDRPTSPDAPSGHATNGPAVPPEHAEHTAAVSSRHARRLQQHAAAVPSGHSRPDQHEHTAPAGSSRPNPQGTTTPWASSPPQELSQRDGTAGERVAHLFTDPEKVADARDRARAALTDAGWNGPGLQRYVEGLAWRCLAVPALVAHFRGELANDRAVIRFVRGALPGGSSDRDTWDDHALADLVLGQGTHAPTVELTDAERACQASLLAWATTGTDQYDDGTVATWGPLVDRAATARGVDRRTVVADAAALAALLRAQDGPHADPPAAPPAPVAATPPARAEGPPAPPRPTGGTPTLDTPPSQDWLHAAELLVTDPCQPDALRQAWSRVDQPARRRLLVNVALDHLENGELDQHRLEVATTGFDAMVGALVRADTRWRDAG